MNWTGKFFLIEYIKVWMFVIFSFYVSFVLSYMSYISLIYDVIYGHPLIANVMKNNLNGLSKKCQNEMSGAVRISRPQNFLLKNV